MSEIVPLYANLKTDGMTFFESNNKFGTEIVRLSMTINEVTDESGTGNKGIATFSSQADVSTKVILRNINDPELSSDAATKYYVDSIAGSGISWKNSVDTSTFQEILPWPPTDGIDTITEIDGVTLWPGKRILIKDQTNQKQNGLYEIPSGSTEWLRTSDMPTNSRAAGAAVWVNEGIENGDKGWVCIADSGEDLVGLSDGSTGNNLPWTKFSSSTPAAGSDMQIQFNKGGIFGADTEFFWDYTQKVLNVDGDVNIKDNKKLILGSDNDFQVSFTDSSNEILFHNNNLLSDTIFKTTSEGSTNFKFKNGNNDTILNILSSTENSTSTTTGAVTIEGGLGVTMDIFANSFNASSDINLKKDILPLENALETIENIQGFSYKWKKDDSTLQWGVLAQQLEEVGLGHMVSDGPIKGVNYLMMIPLLIEAVKELNEKFDENFEEISVVNQ